MLKETNRNMTKKTNPKFVAIDTSMPFHQKEECMFRGLLEYLGDMIGEYLTEEQIRLLAESLRNLRNRPADVEYSDELCVLVSDQSEIRNRYIPRKILRKDEGSVLFYNLAPYALMGRKQTASFAKRAFPNFFASAATINSTFTKFSKVPGSSVIRMAQLSIHPFPEHTTHAVETILFNYGINAKN